MSQAETAVRAAEAIERYGHVTVTQPWTGERYHIDAAQVQEIAHKLDQYVWPEGDPSLEMATSNADNGQEWVVLALRHLGPERAGQIIHS